MTEPQQELTQEEIDALPMVDNTTVAGPREPVQAVEETVEETVAPDLDGPGTEPTDEGKGTE